MAEKIELSNYRDLAEEVLDKFEEKYGADSSDYRELAFGIMAVEAANDGLDHATAALPLFKANIVDWRKYVVDKVTEKLESLSSEAGEAYLNVLAGFDQFAGSGDKSLMALYELFVAEDSTKTTSGIDNLNTALALVGSDRVVKPQTDSFDAYLVISGDIVEERGDEPSYKEQSPKPDDSQVRQLNAGSIPIAPTGESEPDSQKVGVSDSDVVSSTTSERDADGYLPGDTKGKATKDSRRVLGN